MKANKYYTAKQAREDYDKKHEAISEYVDENRIQRILDAIKKMITDMHISQTSMYDPDPEYNYQDNICLSPAEIELLTSLGYKFTFKEGIEFKFMYNIKW